MCLFIDVMCEALLLQFNLVEWSRNPSGPYWDGTGLDSTSVGSALFLNACSLLLSFMLFLCCLYDAIPNAWCFFHLYYQSFNEMVIYDGNVFHTVELRRLSQPAAALQPGCEEMGREWGNGERGEREIERWNGERREKWRQSVSERDIY